MRHVALLLALFALLAALPLARAADETAAPWASRLDALGSASADEAFRLALELEAADCDDLAARAYERVLAVDPEHRAARRALGYEQVRGAWRTGDDLMRAKGFLHHGGRWMTALEFAEATRPQREAAEQRAGEERVLGLLAVVASEDEPRVADARRRLALEQGAHKLPPLAKALRCEPVSLRLYAAEELGRLADPLAVPALLRRAIEDPEPEVRAAVADALRAIGEPSTVHPLGRALDSRYADVRVRAAEALGRLGDVLAAPYILRRWAKRSGDFPRVYFAQVRQISYIQDFDVEVAQSSFIADPIVGVLQEGVVLASKILATEQTGTSLEAVAYEGALRSLAQEDLGADTRAWRRWWEENEADLLEARAARFAD